MSKQVLGVIGAIGAGKTTACAALARAGGFVIDADRIGHEVLETPEVRERLIAQWGEAILHPVGRINRKALGAIVFADDAERAKLQAIVYPGIEAKCREAMAAAEPLPAAKFIVLDAAVLLEAGWNGLVNKLLFVDAPHDLRLTRVRGRGWSEADLASREAAQWPLERKRILADAVIVNDGSPIDLQNAVDRLLTNRGWA